MESAIAVNSGEVYESKRIYCGEALRKALLKINRTDAWHRTMYFDKDYFVAMADFLILSFL